MSRNSRQANTFDARPYHERGESPFDAILNAVNELEPDRDLVLVNSFNPTPLIRVMEKRGFAAQATQVGAKEWHVRFTRR
jgi:uncharacterized protein (DUF2249 family)